MEDDDDVRLDVRKSWVLMYERDVYGAPQGTTRATDESALSQTGFAAGDSRMDIDLDHAWGRLGCSGRDKIEVTVV